MRKKFYLTILIISIFFVKSYSQQDPQYAHNMYNHLATNPAYAGMNAGICVNLVSRKQWVGFEGAPSTTYAGVNMGISKIHGGLGLIIVDDRLGFIKNFQAKLAYSYHKNIGIGKLGIGVGLGMMNKDLDGTWKTPETPASSDQLIPQTAVQKIIFDSELGVFYKIENKLFLGLSVSHINQPKISYPEVTASYLKRHYYATAGYTQRLFNTPIELQPSVFVKSDGTKIQYSANLTALYNKKIWLGVTYRNKDAAIPMAGIQLISGLKIGYAYELGLSKMIAYSKGTHEVYVSYCFDFWKAPNNYKYRCVKYL